MSVHAEILSLLEEALGLLASEIQCRQHFSRAKDYQESVSIGEWADKLTDAIKRRDANPIARAAIEGRNG